MEDKEIKKITENASNDEHSDSDSSLPEMECKICGNQFTDTKTYENHIKGKKHQKMLARQKFLSKPLGTNNGENEIKSDDEDDDSNEIHCDICDKNVSGYTSYMMHLKGNNHAKKLKREKLKKQLINMPEVLDYENGKESDDELLQKPFAHCATCLKVFSGPEPFSRHMKSTVHKRKVLKSKMFEDMKTQYPDETKESNNKEDLFSKCKVCVKSFSGVIPYGIHMKSAIHKRELEKQKVAEEIKEFCNGDTSEGYVCKECKKNFTDPVAFKQHLENNSHEKQKAKKALLEFLKEYPEITLTTVVENQNDESDADEGEMEYFFICKLCHASFSGPESVKDHIKSKKHIAAKNMRKMKKLLKEQKITENDLTTTTDNSGSNNKDSPKSKLQNGISQAQAIPNDDKNKKEKNMSEVSHEEKLDDFEML